MHIVLARWRDGRVSISIAPERDAAITALSEFGDTASAELHVLDNFMMDFRFNHEGRQFCNQAGEVSLNELIRKAYPKLNAHSDPRSKAIEKEMNRNLKTGRVLDSGRYLSADEGTSLMLCRWPNGTFSVVVARDRDAASIELDEFGNADEAEMYPLDSFLADFCLASGDDSFEEIDLKQLGNRTWNEIIEKAYPALRQVALDGGAAAKEAVEIEFDRPMTVGAVPLSIDPHARHLQNESDMPAALVNLLLRQASAAEADKKAGSDE